MRNGSINWIRSFESGGYAADGIEHDHGGHGGHDGASVRVFDHRGHRAEIVTRYEITVDGQPGTSTSRCSTTATSYHGLPQYLVPSAVDMVRAVIDSSYEAPEEIRSRVRAAREET